MSSFDLTLMYLLAAVIGVVVCRYLRLPPMLGYLGAGVLIGPHALAFAQNSEGIRHLGEFGVVFLMFVIGLEFNLPKLRAMRKHVFGLGLLQVMLTMAIATVGALWLATLAAADLAPRLADGAGAFGRAHHEQHRDRREADGRAARTRERTRQARDGRAAVPGSCGGAAAGADPGARRAAGDDAEGARPSPGSRPASWSPCCSTAARA